MGFEAYEEHAPTCTAPYLQPRPAGAGSVEGTPYLYNHLRFVVKFHKEDSFVGARVVGFEVPTAGATVGQGHNMPPATQRGALAPVASP